MTRQGKQHLMAEKQFLQTQLDALPESALLMRMSIDSRLADVQKQLDELSGARDPEKARLLFNGRPVVGTHGVSAEFATEALRLFADAVTIGAASLITPVAQMGPVPNRDMHRLLITGTVLGSFGFELEECCPEQLEFADLESSVSLALEHTRNLLQSTLGTDEELADALSETDPRALEKMRSFLGLLANKEAVCTMQFRGRSAGFTEVEQIRKSLRRLSTDNVHEEVKLLDGQFQGVLPTSRVFEFKQAGQDEILRGKVGSNIRNAGDLNECLHQDMSIKVTATRVGSGRVRYMLMEYTLHP